MQKPDKIIAQGEHAMTLLLLMRGELMNYGYVVDEIKHEYEPNWGEAQLTMEVKEGGN